MKKILLIDDADFARMVLRRILEGKGYEICSEAKDGESGIEEYRRYQPDMVICDYRMTGMDGLSCVKVILAEDPNAKNVICAAMNAKALVDDAYAAGAKAFLDKPVAADRLLRITKDLIGGPKEDPVKKKSPKERMEERAAEEGIATKHLLDYFAAFKSMTGYSMKSAHIDEAYLKEHGDLLVTGMRALVSPKMSMTEIEKLEKIFRELL